MEMAAAHMTEFKPLDTADPQLSALVSRAMQQNHDVRLAMARVSAARAQLRQSRAGLLPSSD